VANFAASTMSEPVQSHDGGSGSSGGGGDFLASAVGRLGLGDLNAEPRRLQASIDALDSELKSLSVQHYGVHLQSAKGVAAASRGCKLAAENASKIQAQLAGLSSSLERFKGLGRCVADAHARNRQTLEKHVQLMELLQIPQLMDTCSRNNLFDEALDLASFASTLQRRHRALAATAGIEEEKSEYNQIQNSTSLEFEMKMRTGTDKVEDVEKLKFMGYSGQSTTGQPAKEQEMKSKGGTAIIDMIAGDVNRSASHMRKQMLQQLRQQINLPTCLRIISLLKRLDAQERVRRAATSPGGAAASEASAHADEIHLRFEFLDCRDAYIKSLAAEDAGSYVTRPYLSSLKLIERCRVNWFDVITQYKAIFASGDNILQELEEDGGILARWVSGKMTDFLLVLEGAIGNIDEFSSLANVLEQAMKFGLSLARVGADFRPLLMEPFKRRIFDLMINYWQQAIERAVPLLESGDWGSPLPLPRASAMKTSDLANSKNHADQDGKAAAEEDGTVEDEANGDQESTSLLPPHELLEFPVIAEATNILLTSFNELRQCATPIVALDLGQVLASQLEKLVEAVQHFRDNNEKNLEKNSELCERYNRLCEVLGHVFLMHIQRCFDAVFHRAKLTRAVRSFIPVTETRDAIISLKTVQQEDSLSRSSAAAAPKPPPSFYADAARDSIEMVQEAAGEDDLSPSSADNDEEADKSELPTMQEQQTSPESLIARDSVVSDNKNGMVDEDQDGEDSNIDGEEHAEIEAEEEGDDDAGSVKNEEEEEEEEEER